MNSEKLFNIALSVFLIILTGILLVSNLRLVLRMRDVTQREDALRSRLEDLEQEKSSLERGMNENETDQYWEERIRAQGYKKPGETVVVIKKDEVVNETYKVSERGWWDVLISFWSQFKINSKRD